MLVDDLTNALVELEGEEGVPVVPVELVNPDVAKIFSKSPRAKVRYRFVCSCGRWDKFTVEFGTLPLHLSSFHLSPFHKTV